MATSSLDRAVARKARPGGGLRDNAREYCRTLLYRLPWHGNGSKSPLGTLGITSSCGGEGVSTVAGQLAETAASAGMGHVLLVDANHVRPSVHRRFEVSLAPGWNEVLADAGQLSTAVQPSSVANLSVIAAGGLGSGPALPSDQDALSDLLEALKADFDLVVFDMAAVGEASCAAPLAGLLDGVLLVVEAERVPWEVAQQATQLLTRNNGRLLGAVLNKHPQKTPN